MDEQLEFVPKEKYSAGDRLILKERIKISSYLKRGMDVVEIGILLNRAKETIQREVERKGMTMETYDPYAAEEDANHKQDLRQRKLHFKTKTVEGDNSLEARIKNIEMQIDIIMNVLNKE